MNRFKFLVAYVPTLFLCFALLVACGKTKTTTEKPSKATAKNKSKSLLHTGPQVREDESYAHIVNSVARLKAMLCGVFVHYNTTSDPEGETYSAWMVNDGHDSVMVYTFPVGEPNKIGHWIYTYQIMTSLPDDPIYVSFAKLTELDRETIKCAFYALPEDFETSLERLLEDPKAYLSKIDVSTLESSEEEEDLLYSKQTPLDYRAETEKKGVNPKDSKVRFVTTYQEIKPNRINFGFKQYDENKKLLGFSTEYLLKEAMLKSDLPKSK